MQRVPDHKILAISREHVRSARNALTTQPHASEIAEVQFRRSGFRIEVVEMCVEVGCRRRHRNQLGKCHAGAVGKAEIIRYRTDLPLRVRHQDFYTPLTSPADIQRDMRLPVQRRNDLPPGEEQPFTCDALPKPHRR